MARRRLILAALAAVLVAPASIAPGQPRATPAQRDWTRVVSMTPEGGYRMGNPAAPIKVVEYLSLTCPHCAEFARDGTPHLVRNYVRSGRVSLEYRNYVLNGVDLAATFLSRCASPANYFALNHAILASQPQWVARVEATTPDQRREIDALEPLARMQRVVALAGLDAVAARHGVSAPQARACMASQAGLERILEMQQAGTRAGVNGTPTFAINGRIVQTNVWAGIEPLLRGQ